MALVKTHGPRRAHGLQAFKILDRGGGIYE